MRTQLCLSAAVLLGVAFQASAAVEYAIDDGIAERTLTIDSGEDQIWMTTFPVQAGGELITSVSAAFGRPGLDQFFVDGQPIRVLVYQDLDGGSPQNATLLSALDTFAEQAHQNVLVQYNVPPVVVQGNVVAAVLFRNQTPTNMPIAAVDTSQPTFANRSYGGWTFFGMNEANLASIPADQFRAIEGFGLNGNFLLRAEGQPIPEPASIVSLVAASVAFMNRRW